MMSMFLDFTISWAIWPGLSQSETIQMRSRPLLHAAYRKSSAIERIWKSELMSIFDGKETWTSVLRKLFLMADRMNLLFLFIFSKLSFSMLIKVQGTTVLQPVGE